MGGAYGSALFAFRGSGAGEGDGGEVGGGEGGEVGDIAGGVGVDQGAGDAAGAVEVFKGVLAAVIIAQPGAAGDLDAGGDFLRRRGGDQLVELFARDLGRHGREI